MESSPYLALEFDLPAVPPAAGPTGYVYFMEREGLIKIGYSTDVRTRLHSISKGNSMPPGMTIGAVSLLATVPGSVADEKRYHRRFNGHRISGTEWFRPDGELRQLVADLAANTERALPRRRAVIREKPRASSIPSTGEPVACRSLADQLGISFGALHQQVTAGNVPTLRLSERRNSPLYVDAEIAEQVRSWHAVNRFRPWPKFPLQDL